MTILQERASSARRAMIDSQLRVSGVNDPAVLAAFERVAREDFVPAGQQGHAYIDRALPLGDGHALAAPLFHGLVLTEARLQPGERVLVVASTGYLAALAAELGAAAETITPAQALEPATGPAVGVVLVDGAIEALPETLVARLGDGGRIVTGTVDGGVTRLSVGARTAGTVALLAVTDLGIPVLAEFAAPRPWSF